MQSTAAARVNDRYSDKVFFIQALFHIQSARSCLIAVSASFIGP